MSLYICPVCSSGLRRNERVFSCDNGHAFDIAKSGYVNLLLSKHAGKTVHGDNKLMLKARRDFLEKGYYQPLRDAVCDAAVSVYEHGAVLDTGCGEGYYTSALAERFRSAGKAPAIAGTDISKIAVEMASKRGDDISYAAASSFALPIADSSCGLLMTIFSPYCGEEFRRVLFHGGYMVMVIPGAEHLWEMKQIIYDTPYKNEVRPYELEGFSLISKKSVRYNITLDSQEDIWSLFTMTPYYYRTGKEQQQRLMTAGHVDTTADFEILTYRKN